VQAQVVRPRDGQKPNDYITISATESLRDGLISFLFEDGTIMLGAEFSQGRGNLRSRTSCGLSVQVD
jgi:hypothetical protein